MPQSDHDMKGMQARNRIEQLTSAVKIYKLNNGHYPDALEALTMPLTVGGGPFVHADMLIDPWGMPYNYDPSGPNNGGEKPDIWVQRPDRVIGNWPTKK